MDSLMPMCSQSSNTRSHDNAERIIQLGDQLDPPIDGDVELVRGLPQGPKALSSLVFLRFAFQSLGVVYGDLGTSPLYVFNSTFPKGIEKKEDLIGVLSLIIYTLTLIPLIKYTCIVMRANDNGEGGTFALYSLICRHAKVKTIPNLHPTDHNLTTYSSRDLDKKSLAGKAKEMLETKPYTQNLLVLLVLLGTCMLIGDGILTPAISVVSSVSGIKVEYPQMKNDHVIAIACAILVVLFSVQRFGTDKVGWFFAPALLVWFLAIGSIGLYNIIKHDFSVLRAFSPVYLVRYFTTHTEQSWLSLGGILLSITGTEALYADLGHFSAMPVQVAFAFLVFPCLLASYIGQAAFLSENLDAVEQAFYNCVPGPLYWPIFVIATIAAIIASQATISATFSIIKQSVALGCFPRVKVVHTSNKFPGQVYIPEINWMLMVLCIIMTAGFQTTVQLGNAYGIAVVVVMLVTTVLMALVMLLVWRTNVILILIFALVCLIVELLFFSAVLVKFDQGGWAPLAIAALFLLVMYAWHYGTLKKYEFDVQNKVSLVYILGMGPSLGLVRVPGIGLIYTELAHGVPSIFSHFMTHLPAMHSIVVFTCIKYLPVNTVPQAERFLIRRIGPKDLCLYRCVARYGYKDLHKRDDGFEENLLRHLAAFIQEDALSEVNPMSEEGTDDINSPEDSEASLTLGSSADSMVSETAIDVNNTCQRRPIRRVRFAVPVEDSDSEVDHLAFLHEARQAGVVHILGDVIVRARRDSSFLKKLALDYVYALLRRVCRENSAALNIPHESLFNVGQVYYV